MKRMVINEMLRNRRKVMGAAVGAAALMLSGCGALGAGTTGMTQTEQSQMTESDAETTPAISEEAAVSDASVESGKLETPGVSGEAADLTSSDVSEASSNADTTEESEKAEQAAAAPHIQEKLQAYYRGAAAGSIVRREDLEAIDTAELFSSEEISDSLFQRIYGKSYKEDCTVSRGELRYLRILHRGFDGETHIGEIICNKRLAGDLLEIFEELYRQDYPIEQVLLIDEFDADDELSMEANNTSCFNFRKVSGSTHLSKHASGRAIDVNPLYNPYVRVRDGETICEPHNGTEYMDRSEDFPYKIDSEDLCYRLFMDHGFEWGGSWNSSKDYQHFQK